MAKLAKKRTRAAGTGTQKTFKVIQRKHARMRGKRKREFVVTPKSFRRAEDGTATMTVTLATEKPVRRYDGIRADGQYFDQYDEVLLMSGLNTARIGGKRGIPFLNAHQTDDLNKVLGRSVPNSLKVGDSACTLDFFLGKRAAKRGYVDDIENGVIADTSVGYFINECNITLRDNGVPLVEATDWTVYENSGVPVPADEDAVIRSEGGKRGKRADDASDESVEDEDDDEREMDDADGDEPTDDERAGDEEEDDSSDDESEEDDGDEERANDTEEEDDDQDEDDLADDESDSDEDKEDKARARELREKIRARKEAKRNGGTFVVLDPNKDATVRQLMDDARECGVFKKVDVIRRTGGTLLDIRAAIRKAYLGVGEQQARSRIVSRPDASATRRAEDGPADIDTRERGDAPTEGQINAEIRRRKQALRR